MIYHNQTHQYTGSLFPSNFKISMSNDSKSNQFEINNIYITFSILAKLLLPKDKIDYINNQFQKLITRKVSFFTLSKNISRTISDSRLLSQIWEIILKRKIQIKDQLYDKIKQIIQYLVAQRLPISLIIQYIYYIIDMKQNLKSKVHLLNNLLTSNLIYTNLPINSTIIQYSVDLYNFLPSYDKAFKRSSVIPRNPIKNISTYFNDLFDESFSFVKKYKITSFSRRRGKELQWNRDVSFSPSHYKYLIPISSIGYSLIFNFYTRSLGPIQENANNHTHHSEYPVHPTTDINEILESPELVEHQIDSIVFFNKNINKVGYHVRAAGRLLYDEQSWKKIEPNLTSLPVREYISNKCRSKLPMLEDAHQNALEYSKAFLETRPVNHFLSKFPIKQISNNTITFPYYGFDSEIVDYCKLIFTSSVYQRYQHLPFFFHEIFKIFPKKDMNTQLVGTWELVSIIYYFMKLIKYLTPLFSDDILECNTYNSVFDTSFEAIISRFSDESNSKHSFLSKTLKSILKYGTIVDENTVDVYQYFGKKSHYLGKIVHVVNYLNQSCEWVSLQPQTNKIISLDLFFGNNDYLLNIYIESMKSITKQQLYLIKNEPKLNQLLVTKL